MDNRTELKNSITPIKMKALDNLRKLHTDSIKKLERNPASFESNIEYMKECRDRLDRVDAQMDFAYEKIKELGQRLETVKNSKLYSFFYSEDSLRDQITAQALLITTAKNYAVHSLSLDDIYQKEPRITDRKYEVVPSQFMGIVLGFTQKMTIKFSDDSSLVIEDITDEKAVAQSKVKFAETMKRLSEAPSLASKK